MLLPLLLICMLTLSVNTAGSGVGDETLLQLIARLIQKLDDSTPHQNQLQDYIKAFDLLNHAFREHVHEFNAYKVSPRLKDNKLSR